MERTKKRPIPVGKIEAENAFRLWYYVIYYLCFNAWSFTELFSGMFARLFYLFLYIYIHNLVEKKRTSKYCYRRAAGAFPPVIGWVCSTGELSIFPLILFLLIFIWTPPHFWALALYKDIEYSKAKVPMLPVVSGQRNTKSKYFLFSIVNDCFFVAIFS